MEIKRIFKTNEEGVLLDKDDNPIFKSNEDGICLNADGEILFQHCEKGVFFDEAGEVKEPVLDYVIVRKLTKRQNFTQRLIDRCIREGFMSVVKGNIILHAKPKDLQYKILRSPGHFCCFDNKPLGGENECRQYIEDNFKGKKSPDVNNPSGYRKDNFHACELIGEI